MEPRKAVTIADGKTVEAELPDTHHGTSNPAEH
jgi:hypothetical protein